MPSPAERAPRIWMGQVGFLPDLSLWLVQRASGRTAHIPGLQLLPSPLRRDHGIRLNQLDCCLMQELPTQAVDALMASGHLLCQPLVVHRAFFFFARCRCRSARPAGQCVLRPASARNRFAIVQRRPVVNPEVSAALAGASRHFQQSVS